MREEQSRAAYHQVKKERPATRRRLGLPLAVSETEIFPTPYDQAETMRKFEEGTRLWLEGYQRPGFYTVVPNREVPHSFVQARGLSTTAAAQVVF
ncbi:hypothetical protein ACA910_019166 [Epithemia clementina (nom. ined.)]